MNDKKKKYIRVVCIISVIFGIVVGIGALFFTNKEKDEIHVMEIINKQKENEEKTKVSDGIIEDDERINSAIEIETSYCMLYFPREYEENFEVKYKEEAAYKVEFYGLVEGKDAQHLFDVCFNCDEGDLLGYLENEGEIINISIDMIDLKFDDTWESDEIDKIYSLQEEMNFVVDTLNKNKNYVEP